MKFKYLCASDYYKALYNRHILVGTYCVLHLFETDTSVEIYVINPHQKIIPLNQHVMVDVKLFSSNYKQKGNICLLASLSFVIGYYRNLSGVNSNMEINSLMAQYLKFLSEHISEKKYSLLKKESIQLQEEIKNAQYLLRQATIAQTCKEEQVSRTLHEFCRNCKSLQGQGIRGYEHIKNFVGYLQKNHLYPSPFGGAKIEYGTYATEGAYDIILDKLENKHCLAMILYKLPSNNYHSIVTGKDNEGIIYRDPNHNFIQRESDRQKCDEPIFNRQLEISEYILFIPQR